MSEQCSNAPDPTTGLHNAYNRPPKISSQQLFGEHHEVLIEHQGQEYRLRITSNQKLILTK